MGLKVLLIGRENTGKSASLKNLDPNTTCIISADKKGLPWIGWDQDYQKMNSKNGSTANYIMENRPVKVLDAMDFINHSRTDIKTLVIDTVTSVTTWDVFENSMSKGNPFEIWKQIAGRQMDLFYKVDSMRDDLTTILIMHTEPEEDAYGELHTAIFYPGGKMVKEKGKPHLKYEIIVETVMVPAEEEDQKPEYKFKLYNSGKDMARLPMGVTDDLYMENDMAKLLNMLQPKSELAQ